MGFSCSCSDMRVVYNLWATPVSTWMRCRYEMKGQWHLYTVSYSALYITLMRQGLCPPLKFHFYIHISLLFVSFQLKRFLRYYHVILFKSSRSSFQGLDCILSQLPERYISISSDRIRVSVNILQRQSYSRIDNICVHRVYMEFKIINFSVIDQKVHTWRRWWSINI